MQSERLIFRGFSLEDINDVYEFGSDDETCKFVTWDKHKNIIETIAGKLITGDEEGYFEKGKVLIAAANPDLMESYIEKSDLVILGNRYESQLCAIEMEASCLIVCDGAIVSNTIQKLAKERNIAIEIVRNIKFFTTKT